MAVSQNFGRTNKEKPTAAQVEDLMVEARNTGASSYSWYELQMLFDLHITYFETKKECRCQLRRVHGKSNSTLVDCFEDDAKKLIEFVGNVVDLEVRSSQKDQGDTFTSLPSVKEANQTPQVDEAKRILNQSFHDMPAFDANELLDKPQHYAGSLELVQISNLVQSILMDKLTGRLSIQRTNAWAHIFFADGDPVHATGSRGSGEECFLQALCWNDGKFEFEPDLQVLTQSIKSSMSSLLLRGARLLDDTNYLKSQGLRMPSIPHKTHSNYSDQYFEKALENRKGVNHRLLKALYLSIDGNRSVDELVKVLELTRSEWVMQMACLLQCKLIELSTDPDEYRLLEVPAKSINAELEKINKVLLNEETGLLHYEAFIFLLNHELSLGREPISLALLSFERKRSEAQAEQIKRIVDSQSDVKTLIGHYSDYFAIAMLDCQVSKAIKKLRQTFSSIVEESTEEEFTLGVIQKTSCGVASIPNDVADIPRLFSACEIALERARKENNLLVLAREVIDGEQVSD